MMPVVSRAALFLCAAVLITVPALPAQAPDGAIVRVVAHRDSVPVAGVMLRTLDQTPVDGRVILGYTDARGAAVLRLPPGDRVLVAARIGYTPDTLHLVLRAGQDTTVVLALARLAALEGIVVAATRGERRVEDTPLRVEVIDDEEIAEKITMTPGDIAMMLNETSGLRVQTTNPSLGGANVRMQGLRGRYTLMLADGLPLYGGQAGGLGLLQIPPLDLGRVEVIKGTASALYGSAALGGVINLVARRPGEEPERTFLVNQTSRGGTDGVVFSAAPLTARWGYTLLAGLHRQERTDLDADGWTDMPGYERVVVRPRLYFDDGAGRTAFLTTGVTAEERTGGTLRGRTTPEGAAYAEALRTRRADLGGLARWERDASVFTVRGSAMTQRHRHELGTVREDDEHRTAFAEAALTVPRGRATYVAGLAMQHDAYRASDVAGFDYTFDVPAVFTQLDVDPAPWLSISASARLDAHSEYGTALSPRVSLLLRLPGDGMLAEWTARLSGGTGMFAPTPFSEETEATGLTPLAPLSGLVAERVRSGSFDLGGGVPSPFGRLEVQATAFGSRLAHPVLVVDAPGTTADGATRIALANALSPARTWGGEVLGRLVHELGEGDGDEEPPALRITATYAYLRATECAVSHAACDRREVPLTPRHSAGVVASVEHHDTGRIGLELYYTGRQSLDQNPFRTESRPYLIVGLLGERAIATRAGVMRLFVNLENITDVRQTRHEPLLRPSRGPGGRWTTDAWTDLSGFTVNGGVRVQW